MRSRNLFNLCSAFLRSHHHHTPGATVNNQSDVVFLNNLAAFFNEEPFHYLPFRTGLMGNQRLSENLFSIRPNLFA
ncbi:hypothetical protein D3C75_1148020 [compost metagenome]